MELRLIDDGVEQAHLVDRLFEIHDLAVIGEMMRYAATRPVGVEDADLALALEGQQVRIDAREERLAVARGIGADDVYVRADGCLSPAGPAI
jgi:hypothetical protein